MQEHNKKVKSVKEQVDQFRKADKTAGVDHGSSNSTRSGQKQLNSIDTKDLDQVIEVNKNKKEVIVEPNVSMRKLVSATLEHNLAPSVVPEFPAITVGGAIQGGAGESGSVSSGLFHEIVKEIEIITGSGKRIKASHQQNQDLFYGSACSYGSLGILTLAKVKLIPAQQFVHLKYHHVDSFAEAIEASKDLSQNDSDFVDGIMYGRNGVIVEGNLSENKNLPVSRFSRPDDEWFYLHVKNEALSNKEYEELVPIQDYFFRYNRGAFWTGKHVFDLLHLPFTKFLRTKLDRGFRTKNMYELLHVTDLSQKYIIQDICLPEESVVEFMEYIDEKHDISPQWVLPIKPDMNSKLSPSYIDTDTVFNVGVWGKISDNFDDYLYANRDLEKIVKQLGGRKVLYAHHYYPEDNFWEIYDQSYYQKLRKKYNARVFPDIYEKTVVKEDYDPSILAGFSHVFNKLVFG